MEQPKPGRQARRRIAWWRAAILIAWLGAVLFCVQFALASAAELEPQAAVMGWGLAAIVLGGGLSVLGAAWLNRYEEED